MTGRHSSENNSQNVINISDIFNKIDDEKNQTTLKTYESIIKDQVIFFA